MEAAAEDVGLPDFGRVPLELLHQVVDHVLALLLVAHDGGHGGLDVHLEHVDGGCAGLELDAVAAALAHPLRLLQQQLLHGGHDDAVARLIYVGEGVGHLVEPGLHPGQLCEQLHQVPVVRHGEPGLAGQGLVEQLPGQLELRRGDAPAQVDGQHPAQGDVLLLPHLLHHRLHLPDVGHPAPALPDHTVHRLLDGVVHRQRVHPGGQENAHLPQRKFVQNTLDDVGDGLLRQLQAVHRQTLDPEAALDVPADAHDPSAVGLGGVEQNHKGLPQGLELGDDPLLRLQIVLPGDVGDGAVGGDDDAHGGVLLDDLPGADLRRLRHGDLVVHPGGHHHPGRSVLKLPHSPPDHVAHAVDQPHREGDAPLQGHVHRLLGHELGLRGHDGPAAAGLGQLVDGPLPAVDVFNVGDYAGLHESLDERALSRPHRPQHPHKQGPAGARGYVLIEIRICHSYLPCAVAPEFDGKPPCMGGLLLTNAVQIQKKISKLSLLYSMTA